MKKIIACLDVKDGRVVKGTHFVDLVDKGDPVELAKSYADQGIDELTFLDITKTNDGHDLMVDLIHRVKEAIPNTPLTVGGGIQSLDDVQTLLDAGVDKVSVASAAVRRPDFINEIADRFGSEVLTIAIDVDKDPETDDYYIYTKGGQQKENILAVDWCKEAEKRGAGSLLITSIQTDGAQTGFDDEILRQAQQSVSIPIIASGGAGSIQDFVDLFMASDVEYGLGASVFHNQTVDIQALINRLDEEGMR